MNVTVFCSSHPSPADYQAAYRLGQLLALAGHTVLTGGYMGGMEAVSHGASQAGGRVIGVTCDEIEQWRPVKPNPWVQEERRCARLNDRLTRLMADCDAAIALPGGPGTLAEIALMWNHLIIAALTPRPLIVVGPGWRAVFEAMWAYLGDYTSAEQRRRLQFAAQIDEAMALLEHQTAGKSRV